MFFFRLSLNLDLLTTK